MWPANFMIVCTETRLSQLSEQLKAHYTSWMVLLNVKQSLSMSSLLRRPVISAIWNKTRLINAPPVPSRTLIAHIVPAGFNTPPPGTNPPNTLQPSVNHYCGDTIMSGSPLTGASESTSMPTSIITATASPNPSNPPSSSTASRPPPLPANSEPQGSHSVRNITEMLARKRIIEALESTRPQKKERKRRTCRKCGHPECPGNQCVSNCKNPCQDCGRINCEGRNPKKKAGTPCDQAWE